MIKVCIVDDLPVMRESLTSVLKDSLEIICIGVFPNAEELINSFCDLRPDITLMDIDLPGISGIEAISLLKKDYPVSRFLVLTIFNDDEKIFQALKAGAGGYLLKKHVSGHLISSITSLYDNGAPMSPEVARKVLDYFSRKQPNDDLTRLSEKEKNVLQYIVNGFLYKEIASELAVTIDAIKKHANNIYEKLQVR